MLRALDSTVRVGLLVGAAALAGAGCLCPPCPAGGAVAGGAASPSSPESTAAASSNTSGASSSRASPARLVIWDGDKVGAGQSWASCNKKGECQSVLAKSTGVGVNKSSALKWHGQGPDWMGAGWNWFGWYPQGSGTDVSAYASLTFQVRFEAKSPDLAPEGESLGFGLTCSGGDKCTTARVPLRKYVADYDDGQWHKVVIPIDDLLAGEGAGFDKKKAWEFDFSEWSGTPRDFTVYVDDIAFEK